MKNKPCTLDSGDMIPMTYDVFSQFLIVAFSP